MQRTSVTQSRSVAVLKAVATRDGRDLSALPPLYEVVDPEALDALFSPRFDGTSRPGGDVTFPYAGYTVTVSANGDIELQD